ncbi:hypothetical protein Bca101_082368 [Brassica carinata]
MANSYTVLADLRAGRCSNTAESTLVQGSVPAALQLTFRGRLSEGSIYTLRGFDVTRSNPKFRLSDEPVSIRFNEGTAFHKIATTARIIPTEHFRFQPYEHILELANTGKQLPGNHFRTGCLCWFSHITLLVVLYDYIFDVMGELCAIRSTITDLLPGAPRVMLTLRVESKFDGYGREPKIVVVTGINPKIVSGKLYLNGTSATRVFFDCGGTDQEGSSSKVVHAQKIEPLTIAELNQFVITADPQIIEFLCTAKVTGVQLADGWFYIGCSGCEKKLIREESSFTCASCNETNAVAELKYRVVFSVSDVTGIAGFVGFDKEVAKLTHVLASEAAQIVGIGVNAQAKGLQFYSKPPNLPSPASFLHENLHPIQPLLQERAEDPEPAVPQIGAPRTDATDRASSSDSPLLGREAAGEGGVTLEESATKKARVE